MCAGDAEGELNNTEDTIVLAALRRAVVAIGYNAEGEYNLYPSLAMRGAIEVGTARRAAPFRFIPRVQGTRRRGGSNDP